MVYTQNGPKRVVGEMKTCIRCKKEKPEEEFGWHNKSIGRRRTVCRVCRNKDAKSWRKQAASVINKKVKDRYKAKKSYWIERMGGKCSDCGVSYPDPVYDLHHLDPSEKEGPVCFTKSDAKIEKEIKKCVLLCANCHRIRHMNEGYPHDSDN